MKNIFWPYLDKFAIVYLNNIIIYSKTNKKHLEQIEKVLQALFNHQLYAKLSKCIIGIKSLEFCRHVVGNGTVKSITSKVKIIDDWSIPKTIHEVRQFLGLVSYYRWFVKRFAWIAGPLFDLFEEGNTEIKKKKYWPIRWTASCQYSFYLLKKTLISEPVLI